MKITEVHIKLADDQFHHLKAFVSIVIEGVLTIHDIRIIKGNRGFFISMPDRKLEDRCPECGEKNYLRASFCNKCGTRLAENRAEKNGDGRLKLHADVVHPITSEFRIILNNRILEAYYGEVEKSKEPGYACKSGNEVVSGN